MRFLFSIFRNIFGSKRRAFNSKKSHEEKKLSFRFLRDEHNDLLKVKVVQILDGDTVDVLDQGKKIRIRLDSIDCPEGGQPWGSNAKSALIGLIGGRYVHLEVYGFDIYNRTLATVYVKTGPEFVNVNERMVLNGHAWVMLKYYKHLSPSRKYQLNQMQRWARANRVGLWKSDQPVPPWKWRLQLNDASTAYRKNGSHN